MALDERLRREIERAAQPADPSGVYERLIGRKERRRVVRRVELGILSLVVVAGTAVGLYGLSRVFGPTGGRIGSPSGDGRITYVIPTERFENGVLVTSIYWAEPDGSRRVKLLDHVGVVTDLDWSPDGRRLVFGQRDLFVFDRETGDITQVAGPDAYSPSWSPDGTRIAFTTDTRGTDAVVTVAADGTDRRVVVDGFGDVGWTDWSPDGDRIAFVGPGPEGSNQGWDIYVADMNGSNVTNLTNSATVDLDPSWSPDGSTILFRSRRDPPPDWPQDTDAPDELYLMDSDGSVIRRLTNDSSIDQSPVWSPDGAQIAFTSMADEQTAVFTMLSDGTGRELILDVPAIALAWQPPLTDGGDEPSPTPEPTGSTGAGEDIGLGLRLCDVTTVRGAFSDEGADVQTAFVGTQPTAEGCPPFGETTGVAALDLTGDGFADLASEPFGCEGGCLAYAAPDVDGDGTDELLVQDVFFTIVGLRLFNLDAGGSALVTPMVEPPGDPALAAQGFDGSAPPRFWIGGDAFVADALRCEDRNEGRVLISTTAESLPHDSPDAVWQIHETTFRLADGLLRVIEAKDLEEPAGLGTRPSFMSTGGCGADLDPGP